MNQGRRRTWQSETRHLLFCGVSIGMIACGTAAEPAGSSESARASTEAVILPVDDSPAPEPASYREVMHRRTGAHAVVQRMQSTPLDGAELERLQGLSPRLLEAAIPAINAQVVRPFTDPPNSDKLGQPPTTRSAALP
jgi:hypothetical protein